MDRDRTSPGRCNYCGATESESGFTEKVVIHRDRDDYGKRCIAHTRFTVCKDKPCGGNLQMAFEG